MARYTNEWIAHNPQLFSHLWKVARFSLQRQGWRDFDELEVESHFQADAMVSKVAASTAPKRTQTLVSVLGHASIVIQKPQLNILIDPVWSYRVGPFGIFGPKRERPISPLADLPKPDMILISHDHYDHLDLNALAWLCQQHDPLILAGKGVGRIIGQKVPSARIVELAWWESYCLGQYQVTFIPAQHFSGRSIRMNESLWGGFMVEGAGEVLYYVGDSGYQPKINDRVAEKFPDIDLALIPIGSYEPYAYLKHYHLSPGDAVQLFTDLNIQKAFAVHFGTFHLSMENGDNQVKAFLQARQSLGARAHDFILPNFGAAYLIDKKR